jgi:putative FmdB family regulatory protein
MTFHGPEKPAGLESMEGSPAGPAVVSDRLYWYHSAVEEQGRGHLDCIEAPCTGSFLFGCEPEVIPSSESPSALSQGQTKNAGKGLLRMPIYEYHCEGCEHQFETLVLSTSERVVCPSCGTENIRRVCSVFGFRSGGDKGAASSRTGTGTSACSGCTATSCKNCH